MASIEHLLQALGERLAAYRIARNLKQTELAAEAGIGRATLARLEQNGNASIDTLARVLIALDLEERLLDVVPDAKVNPLDPLAAKGKRRQRVRDNASANADTPWTWGDDPR